MPAAQRGGGAAPPARRGPRGGGGARAFLRTGGAASAGSRRRSPPRTAASAGGQRARLTQARGGAGGPSPRKVTIERQGRKSERASAPALPGATTSGTIEMPTRQDLPRQRGASEAAPFPPAPGFAATVFQLKARRARSIYRIPPACRAPPPRQSPARRPAAASLSQSRAGPRRLPAGAGIKKPRGPLRLPRQPRGCRARRFHPRPGPADAPRGRLALPPPGQRAVPAAAGTGRAGLRPGLPGAASGGVRASLGFWGDGRARRGKRGGAWKSRGGPSPEQRRDRQTLTLGGVEGGRTRRKAGPSTCVFPTTSLRGKTNLFQHPLPSEEARPKATGKRKGSGEKQ